MEKIKVGLLTMSDGREYLHQDYIQLNMDYQRDIKEALESTGLFQVTAGDVPIHSNEEAKREAMKLQKAGVEATIFNYTIWCYPQLPQWHRILRRARICCSATFIPPSAVW